MQSVESDGLKKLDSDLKELLDDMPELRRELHEEIAGLMKQEVDGAIAAAGLSSRVQGWQREHVGSGGGYAAVRAVGAKEGAKSGPNGPAAITNYLENGHRLRVAGRTIGYVSGRGFYAAASGRVEAKAIAAAEKFVETVAKRLEGE